MPFRTAHAITARSVKQAIAGKSQITADIVSDAVMAVHGEPIAIDPAWLERQLDPDAFVQARTVAGGPAKSAVKQAITEARACLAADQWPHYDDPNFTTIHPPAWAREDIA